MTGNIVVFPGVTLNIEPGVEVRVKENGFSGTQYYLETRGTINMIGTSDAPILRMVNKFGAPTSLNEHEIQETIKVFPNPVNDQLTISNNNSLSTYSLFTVDGKEILRDRLSAGNTTICMTHLPSGIYLLVLIGDDLQRSNFKIVHF